MISKALWPWIRNHAALVSLGACFSMGAVVQLPLLRQLDVQFTDQVQRWSSTGNAPPNITIVAVDAYSLQQAANIDLSIQDELRDLQH